MDVDCKYFKDTDISIFVGEICNYRSHRIREAVAVSVFSKAP
jgi:hypothetical protein